MVSKWKTSSSCTSCVWLVAAAWVSGSSLSERFFTNQRNIFTWPTARSWISLACPMFLVFVWIMHLLAHCVWSRQCRVLQFPEAVQGQTEVRHAFLSHTFLIGHCRAGWDLRDTRVSFGIYVCVCVPLALQDLFSTSWRRLEFNSCFFLSSYVFFHLPVLVTCPTQASIFLVPQYYS